MNPETEALIAELLQRAGRMADALEDLLFTETTTEDHEQAKAAWQGYVDFCAEINTRAWGSP